MTSLQYETIRDACAETFMRVLFSRPLNWFLYNAASASYKRKRQQMAAAKHVARQLNVTPHTTETLVPQFDIIVLYEKQNQWHDVNDEASTGRR
jgi:hypothetical protein